MRKTLAVAIMAVVAAAVSWAQAPAPADQAKAGAAAPSQWTGFVTDTHCGAKGAVKEHTVACVEKCMKAGSKAQILNDADQKIYDLDSFDKVKPLMGTKVTVKGSLSADGKTITVGSAAKAEQ